MQKQLLREWMPLPYDSKLVKEDRAHNGGRLILSGIIQKADTPNQNKRIYPMSILRREVENYMKAVRENRSVGELDHPDSSTVSLTKTSHVIREIWWKGNEVWGRVEVLPTRHGKDLEAIIESGVTIGISSRGVGSTEKGMDGLDIVQPDFQIICWDIVSEPSTPGAYLFTESKKIDYNPKQMWKKSDRIYRALNEIVVK